MDTIKESPYSSQVNSLMFDSEGEESCLPQLLFYLHSSVMVLNHSMYFTSSTNLLLRIFFLMFIPEK